MQPKNVINLAFFILFFALSSNAEALVKKSKSGICHDTYSANYTQTKDYESFSTLQSCLDSGGDLPKNYKGNSQATKNSLHKTDSSIKDSRKQFESEWVEQDGDCRNFRMKKLIKFSWSQVQFKSSKKCEVKSGKWLSLFTGEVINNVSEVDIDHFVPLAWAWKHGAHSWSKAKRVEFANDPANLLSVEASLKRQRDDKDIDKWLPPKYKCKYITRFLKLQKSYALEVSKTEAVRFKELKNTYCR